MTPLSLFTHTPVCLAPMAGYTDAVFRALCREAGAEWTVTEMISAQALVYESARTQTLLQLGEGETAAVQLFGHKPQALADAAKTVIDLLGGRCLGIDLNMGCPAHKITANGEGSALMLDPLLASKIVNAVSRAVPVPVSVKIRKGWDEDHKNAVDFARILEESGASFLTVHGRTRAEQYSGLADWSCIAAVKRAVKIPVIGNGDIKCGADAVRLLSETACDGLMVGRAALGSPFLFREIRCALTKAPYTPPTHAERCSVALRHAEMTFERKGPRGILELRKHLPHYFAGCPGAVRLRTGMQTASTLAEIQAILLDTCEAETYNKKTVPI